MDPNNHVRTLEAGSGQKAYLIFSDKTSEVSAFLTLKDGTSKAVANENFPKELKMLKTLDPFNSFLNNAQARGTILSDGEAKLYVMQKGLGGGDKPNALDRLKADLANFGNQPPMLGQQGIPGGFPSVGSTGVYGSAQTGTIGAQIGTTNENFSVGVWAQQQRNWGFRDGNPAFSKPNTSFGFGFRGKF